MPKNIEHLFRQHLQLQNKLLQTELRQEKNFEKFKKVRGFLYFSLVILCLWILSGIVHQITIKILQYL